MEKLCLRLRKLIQAELTEENKVLKLKLKKSEKEKELLELKRQAERFEQSEVGIARRKVLEAEKLTQAGKQIADR